MERCCKIAGLYLATLKAIYLVHQHSHWTTKGANFYGNHLLFQRLYEAAQDSADSAAEKFLGLFGEDGVDFQLQNELLHKVLTKFEKFSGELPSKNAMSKIGNLYDANFYPVEMSLTAEKEFLKLSKEAYDAFEDEGVMTLGLDDMIMSIASKSEEAVYLLQQSLKK